MKAKCKSITDITRLVQHTKQVLLGKEDDSYGIAAKFWSAVAYSLFDSIFAAFLVKSAHGVDDLGQSWKDLDPRTKAYNRRDARKNLTLYDNFAVRTPGLRVRPTLTPQQNRAWAGRWYGLWVALDGDKEHAAGSTWDYFKAKGVPTLLGLTHNLKLPILNQTGTLQKSLFPTPLSGGLYVPIDKFQIFRPSSGKLTIGTSRPDITSIHEVRPLWPKSIGPWLVKAVSKGRDAIFKEIPNVLGKI